jgi:beta-glucosidase
VGPRATEVLIDFYTGTLPYTISVLDGIKEKVGNAVEINHAENNEYNAAVDAARASDVAIVVVGNDPYCGAESLMGQFNDDLSTKECPDCGEGREGRDRLSISLTAEDLIKEIYAVNPNTIVVLISSFPYAINWTDEHVPAILHITHAAQEQGTAIADVLFGDYNPGGRLVQTWPKSLAQLPYMLDYNIRNGRTYMYMKEEPLYAFGYGLSYTTFAYSNLRTSRDRLSGNGSIAVSVDVQNTGDVDGDEVVQLYVRHNGSAVIRPIKALKGFERISLKAGETKTVELALDAVSLAYWDETAAAWELEKGEVTLLVGDSSDHILLEKSITVSQ